MGMEKKDRNPWVEGFTAADLKAARRGAIKVKINLPDKKEAPRARPFSELRDALPPEVKARAEAKTKQMLKDIDEK